MAASITAIRSRRLRCRIIVSRQLIIGALFLGIVLTCMCHSEANANVINDVNNMLRDATTTETETAAVADTDTAAYDADRQRSSNVISHQILRNSETVNNMKKFDSNETLNKKFYMRNQLNQAFVGDETSASDDASDASETSVELLRFVNDNDNENDDDDEDDNNDDDDDYKNNNNHNDKDNNNNEVQQRAILTTMPTGNSKRNSASDIDMLTTDRLSLEDQVRLLTKQLNALMTRRREDYEILEHNLRKSLRITTNAESVDLDVRDELKQLRLEVKALRDNQLGSKSNNKERLTIEWLQQSVAELRKQLSELQQMANSATKDIRQRKESYEDLATIRNDFQQLKLELIALRESHGTIEVYVRELREELLQQEEDFKRMLYNLHERAQHRDDESNKGEGNGVELNDESMADHKRRHCRFQRQQIHELQLSQRRMKQKIDELKFHRIDERVRNIEIEQHRIADANFNLSRQIASLDRLHSSLLELLEDVEGLQNKMDKNIPELRHEISKLEFSNAQLNSEQSLVREEGKNVARSVQAMAVSISTLQDERGGIKLMQNSLNQLRTNFDRFENMMQDIQRALSHRRKTEFQHDNGKAIQAEQEGHHHRSNKYANTNNNYNNNNDSNSNNDNYNNKVDKINSDGANGNGITNQHNNESMTQRAESLVAKLENVEQQYESIINKLSKDCSDVSNVNSDVAIGSGGIDANLYMIAPAGQHHPLMVHCSADGWTTVQRRFDGSADFNCSWEDYAKGFGTPNGEYWIGNEQLHHLTLSNCTSLRVIMQDIYDNTWVAEYSQFHISSRDDGYRLYVNGYNGNASDALDYQQGMQFSAIDVDRDISQTHCAANYEGGWWFSHCQHANLNGRYNLGLTWFDASRNEWIAVKSSQMLIKRHQETESCGSILGRSSASSRSATIISSNAEKMPLTSLPVTATTKTTRATTRAKKTTTMMATLSV